MVLQSSNNLYRLHLANFGDRPAGIDETASSPLSDFAGSVTVTGSEGNSAFDSFDIGVSMSQAF